MRRFRRNIKATKHRWFRNPLVLQWLTFASVVLGGIGHWYLVDRPNTKLSNEQLALVKAQSDEVVRRIKDSDLVTRNMELTLSNLTGQMGVATATVDRARYEKIKMVDDLVDSMTPVASIDLSRNAPWFSNEIYGEFHVANTGPKPYYLKHAFISAKIIRLDSAPANSLIPTSDDISVDLIGGTGLIMPTEKISGTFRLHSKVPLTAVARIDVHFKFTLTSRLDPKSKSYAFLKSEYSDTYIDGRLTKPIDYTLRIGRD